MPKTTRIYSNNNCVIIAGRDIAAYVIDDAPIPANAAPTRGHDFWALRALAEDMAARHASARQADGPRPDPADATPPDSGSET